MSQAWRWRCSRACSALQKPFGSPGRSCGFSNLAKYVRACRFRTHNAVFERGLIRNQTHHLLRVTINQEPFQKVFHEMSDGSRRSKIAHYKHATRSQLIIQKCVQPLADLVAQVIVEAGRVDQVVSLFLRLPFALRFQESLHGVLDYLETGLAVMLPLCLVDPT